MQATLHLKFEPAVRLFDDALEIPKDTPAQRCEILNAAKSGDVRAVERLKERYRVLYWGAHDEADKTIVI